ncbi:hypothetical protein AGABI1DRAFT_113492 [Agaricus bisporus var. burnettii JB137-S8]|uniref:Gamma interferon inducible lysosomal thiol reductase GILT n=1 Tax=Agaricus bisporus var. burnettii (strain JB137-S8 / ATCC MYA-4627 / FGSC 10392) TaxID=597362 RepID=K5XAL3_AGABU|nr:uncharacterized protein AGABI1DRAFT_113492 [Agaricus bisporus var. burnettii JB137-S8]EKM80293.1 hypothetical protein AGABI1DRAFT_113492 [Agaricus bisporus var. burnettii JB137-S8]
MYLPLLTLLFVLVSASPHVPLVDQTASDRTFDSRVPVQLGVMSKCPDALLCESTFNEVLGKVGDKMDLSLVYVAKFDESEPDFGGIICKHGAEECAGNVQQLCIAKYASPDQWWNFVQCQNFEGTAQIGKPSVALKCAEAAQIDWNASGAGQCAGEDGSGKEDEGVDLLRKSVRLAHDLEVTKSCTIIINSRRVCVHDGTWKECEGGHTVNDFVRQINDEYDRLNSFRG